MIELGGDLWSQAGLNGLGLRSWKQLELIKGRKGHEGEEQEVREDQGMERVTLQSGGPRCDAEPVRCVDVHC